MSFFTEFLYIAVTMWGIYSIDVLHNKTGTIKNERRSIFGVSLGEFNRLFVLGEYCFSARLFPFSAQGAVFGNHSDTDSTNSHSASMSLSSGWVEAISIILSSSSDEYPVSASSFSRNSSLAFP